MRTSRPYRILLPLALLGFAQGPGCSPGAMPIAGGGNPGESAAIEERYTLQIGDEREIPGTRQRLGFLGVPEDSRCPVDVQCVWEGDAEVQLSFTSAAGVREVFSLHTNVDPRATLQGGAYIELVGLTPLPLGSQDIVPGSYTAEFVFDASRGPGGI